MDLLTFASHRFDMPDFTLNTYVRLLLALKDQRYTFQKFAEFIKDPAGRTVILRHDVDARNLNSLKTAHLENDLGINGTYYFRMVPGSFDEEIIRKIYDLGHETGYHYEDLCACAAESKGLRAWGRGQGSEGREQEEGKKLADLAIVRFRENLEKLRRVVPVETICMHGSPLSRWDNKLLWKYYDYKALGIAAEPYFDIDFNDVLYLTDTGRRWDGASVSVRDKIPSLRHQITHDNKISDRRPKFKSTFDIISSASEGSLPDKIMITVHPQRWTNAPQLWLWELISQKVKNSIKYFLASRQSPV